MLLLENAVKGRLLSRRSGLGHGWGVLLLHVGVGPRGAKKGFSLPAGLCLAVARGCLAQLP